MISLPKKSPRDRRFVFYNKIEALNKVLILYNQELKNVHFFLSEICARQIYPNFFAWYAPLYAPNGNFLLQEQLTN